MRKIESKMCAAVQNLTPITDGNTSVAIVGTTAEVFLHGHKIAIVTFYDSGEIALASINLCGWNTRTTRSRLTALLQSIIPSGPDGIGVSTKAGQARIHDARGRVNISSNDWITVYLD